MIVWKGQLSSNRRAYPGRRNPFFEFQTVWRYPHLHWVIRFHCNECATSVMAHLQAWVWRYSISRMTRFLILHTTTIELQLLMPSACVLWQRMCSKDDHNISENTTTGHTPRVFISICHETNLDCQRVYVQFWGSETWEQHFTWWPCSSLCLLSSPLHRVPIKHVHSLEHEASNDSNRQNSSPEVGID